MLEKSFFIFLLGRPGCGKSAFFRSVTEKLEKAGVSSDFIRIDDFPKMEQMWEEVQQKKDFSQIKEAEDGGFIVTDFEVYNTLLKMINEDLVKLKNDKKIIFVEFSRANNIESLKNFDKDILKNSVIVYIYASFETCWQRNVDRVKKQKEQGIDAHYVPYERMKETYEHDDQDKLEKNPPATVIIVDTENAVGLEKIDEGAEKLVGKLKEILTEN